MKLLSLSGEEKPVFELGRRQSSFEEEEKRRLQKKNFRVEGRLVGRPKNQPDTKEKKSANLI
jgi:hypothetical protein